MKVFEFIAVFVLLQGLWALLSYRRFCRELRRDGTDRTDGTDGGKEAAGADKERQL